MGNSRSKNNEVRDPDMPKKPSTAYILYFKEHKDKFMKLHPNQVITEITKLIAKEWAELPKEKQLPYLRDAEITKFNYINKMKEYAKTHPGVKIPGQTSKRKGKGPMYSDGGPVDQQTKCSEEQSNQPQESNQSQQILKEKIKNNKNLIQSEEEEEQIEQQSNNSSSIDGFSSNNDSDDEKIIKKKSKK